MRISPFLFLSTFVGGFFVGERLLADDGAVPELESHVPVS